MRRNNGKRNLGDKQIDKLCSNSKRLCVPFAAKLRYFSVKIYKFSRGLELLISFQCFYLLFQLESEVV